MMKKMSFGLRESRRLKMKTEPTDDLMEITVYDGAGNVVEHSFAEPFRATEEQHMEIIALVNGGMQASDAARLVLAI